MQRKIFIVGISAVLGFFIIMESRSLENVNEILLRDSQSNICEEIKILKEKNESLKKETLELESNIELLSDQNSALNVVEEEIKKYSKLNGKFPVFGPGITLTLDDKLNVPWIIDIINHFFNSGGEAVSVNGIRIVNETMGFDALPNGQIFLNGSILSPPYVFNVIGESSKLQSVLELPGGIFDRLQASFPKVKINVVQKDIIQMD